MGARAGSAHVGVSIVGIDRVGIHYYKAKLAQEELIRRSGVPWTVVRATQYHPFLATASRPSRELVVPLASAWSAAALLHALYHVRNLDGFGAGDGIALTSVLVAALALPVLAIVITLRERGLRARAPTALAAAVFASQRIARHR